MKHAFCVDISVCPSVIVFGGTEDDPKVRVVHAGDKYQTRTFVSSDFVRDALAPREMIADGLADHLRRVIMTNDAVWLEMIKAAEVAAGAEGE